MAAKNTISILQTIKKKMQKFDGAGAIDDSNTIHVEEPNWEKAPVKQVVPQEMPQQDLSPKFEDDLGLSDLDDENAFAQKADTGQRNQLQSQSVAAEEESDLDEESLMHEDDEIDRLLEEDHDLYLPENSAPEQHAEETVEDYGLDDENNELTPAKMPVPQQLNPAPIEHDELFDELEHEPEPQAAAPAAQVAVAQEEDDDFNFDDLEDEADDISEQNPVAEKASEPSNYSDTELDELDHLENEIKQQEAAKKIAEAQIQTTAPSKSVSQEPEEKDEIDLEFEKEFLNYNPPSQQAAPAPIQKQEALNINQNFPKMPEYIKPNTVSAMPQYPQVTQKNSALISEQTMHQTTESVKKLIDAKNMIGGVSSFTQSPILAEIALHLLEPKLERWLNENLAQMVEEIVREEISKIIPKE